jgi:7-carboxy-7-deazaguanine synthase
MNKLRINEIFYSLQGESSTIGLPTVFIRLTGCPLRCQYCDTEYAFTEGSDYTIDDILGRVAEDKPDYVCVTGGEPLAQQNCLLLLSQLCDQGYQVSLETSGALSVKEVDSRVSKIMDVKTPDSGEAARNLWGNLDYITARDELKFVICSREDYLWCKDIAENYLLFDKNLIFSPSFGEIDAQELAGWVIEDHLPIRFQVQLHKYLWDDEPGH